MHTLLSTTFEVLNRIIQPDYCIFCLSKIAAGKKKPICSKCFKELKINQPPFCRQCGKSIKNAVNHICRISLSDKEDFRIFYPLKYEKITREALHKLKYEGQLNLVRFFSFRMAALVKEHILPFNNIDFITYVPLHKKKLKEREFNQSELLAKGVSSRTKIPLIENLISRTIYTRPQSKLSEKERKTNLRGAFKINGRYKDVITGSHLLLIDDIITTGSTVKECLKEIKKHAAKVIVLAAAGG